MAIKEAELAKSLKPYTGQRGVYVSRVLVPDSQDKLIDFVHKHGMCQMDATDMGEIHCTIIHSASPLPDPRVDLKINPLPCAARVVGFDVWPGHDGDGYLVALLQSPMLNALNRLWKLRGCVPTTYDEYLPHITIKTPFEPDRGFTRQQEIANEALANDPMLIILHKEVIEDIK